MIENPTHGDLEQGIKTLEKASSNRKTEEEPLPDAEALFRSLFEQHPAVKLIIDPSTGEIIEANAAAAEFYGWAQEKLKRMRIQDINTLAPEEVNLAMEKVRFNEKTHFEFRHRLADGSIRDVDVFSGKIRSRGKEFLYSIVHDITARKLAEEALRERAKELNCLFSIADLISEKKSLEEILQGTAELMIHAWRYPEMSCVRITFENQEFKTENFQETAWKISEEIIVSQKPVGLVEVCYLRELPEKDKEPFLKEELALTHAVAERLGKVAQRMQSETEREKLISELKKAISEIKTLSGFLPICANCKKIRNDKGYWEQIESYIRSRSEAEFSHGICPECARKLYPGFYKK